MEQCQALLVHSPSMPLSSVRQQLEGRGFVVHLSSSWEGAARISARMPAGQPKYVFIDTTLYSDQGWGQSLCKMQETSVDTVFISFHPQAPHSLYALLSQGTAKAETSTVAVSPSAPPVVGESEKFRNVLTLAQRYARYDITILVTGETGAGKEVLARYIHAHSTRKDGPLVACNMTAIPETLVESELFGYVKGAFTGADKNKKGLIEAAEGGTLFLDEIGDLAPAIQLKLLRFLESREFYRVGESVPKTANVRVIAATNKDLEEAMRENRFREDLYYRLNSARVILPPLRERKEDIERLAEVFVEQVCERIQQPCKKISQSVQAFLLEYPWPGNIRELKNAIESAVMVADGEYITLGDLPMHLQQYATSHREEIGTKVIRRIDAAERATIEEALRTTNNDKAQAAKLLGISVRTLYRKLEKFAVSGAENRSQAELELAPQFAPGSGYQAGRNTQAL